MVLSAVTGIAHTLLDLIYPPTCAGCGHEIAYPSGRICPACREKLVWLPPPYCLTCGAPVKAKKPVNRCEECLDGPMHFNQARAVFSYYDPIIRNCIHAMKFGFQSHLAKELGAFVAEAFSAKCRGKYDAIVPVPLHKHRLRLREFNQATLLAEPLAAACDIPIRADLVRRKKHTKPQSQLQLEERMKNPVDAFEPVRADAAKGLKIIVIDDIHTTGATANQVSAALRGGGAKKIFVITLARAVEVREEDSTLNEGESER